MLSLSLKKVRDRVCVIRGHLCTFVRYRGSHTHTVVTDSSDKDNIYIYVSGSAGVRNADELPGCASGGIDDPNTALFRIEVIKVPLADPAKAAIVTSPRIFGGLEPAPRNPERDAGSVPEDARRCHNRRLGWIRRGALDSIRTRGVRIIDPARRAAGQLVRIPDAPPTRRCRCCPYRSNGSRPCACVIRGTSRTCRRAADRTRTRS